MSRAFVDEDAQQSEESGDAPLKVPVPGGSRNYLTPEGAEALSREIVGLKEEALPRAQADLAALMAAGAASDAADAARRKVSRLERRVAYLSEMASLAEVVPPPATGTDRVMFGALVEVREEDGSAREYRIVGIDEARPEDGRVPWTSPVARALMGKRAGDQATVKLPQGGKRLTVLTVSYP